MSEKIISSIKSEFQESVSIISSEGKTVSMTVEKGALYDSLSWLKDNGFDHLSDITCVDYIDEKEFELVYHLWSHEEKSRVNVKTRISRKSPSIRSISDLWTGAQFHEREIHELFGVDFEGNSNLSPLFLEDWEEIPPFRKDFDTREYVRREYYGEE